MAVMAREAWTDERLDDLVKRMDTGFDEVKGEIRDVKAEIREVKAEVAEFRQEMNARFDSMQQTLMICFAGLGGSIAASAVGALLVTQL